MHFPEFKSSTNLKINKKQISNWEQTASLKTGEEDISTRHLKEQNNIKETECSRNNCKTTI